MKTLLIGINSKYIHTLPSIYILKANAKTEDVEILETNINIETEKIIELIKGENFEVFAFSVYIFNLLKVKELIKILKTKYPSNKILVGGAELHSFYDDKNIDFIIVGEGEKSFNNFVQGKIQDRIIIGEKTNNLDEYSSIYTSENLLLFENKIVYFESSRGCPFKCSFCMSGNENGVRYFSLNRVKTDLMFLLANNVRIVKFVDRTFNASRERFLEIVRFLIEKDNFITTFHFECAGDILFEECLNVLALARNGLFQLEIGFQSLNEETLCLVRRKTNITLLKDNIKKIIDNANVHLHLDLIAGLPKEDLNSFKNGFNEVIILKPHVLQLGFLKLLFNTHIRAEKDKYGYIIQEKPPYELIKNDCLSEKDIQILKIAEKGLDIFYNSGKFFFTLGLISLNFDLFYDLGKDLKANNLNYLCEYLFDFLKDRVDREMLLTCLKLDYLVKKAGFMFPKFFELKGKLELKNDVLKVLLNYDVSKNEKIETIYLIDYKRFNKVTKRYEFETNQLLRLKKFPRF